MELWQTAGCTAPCGWMTPVRVKNWLMEEQRSAIWVGSRDQLLSSACLMLSFRPVGASIHTCTHTSTRTHSYCGYVVYKIPNLICPSDFRNSLMKCIFFFLPSYYLSKVVVNV